jgi:hypothetical protein
MQYSKRKMGFNIQFGSNRTDDIFLGEKSVIGKDSNVIELPKEVGLVLSKKFK